MSNNPNVKTSSDWMSLFRVGGGVGGVGGVGGSSRYSSEDAAPRRYDSVSSPYDTTSRYASSRYDTSASSSRLSEISSRYDSGRYDTSRYDSGRRSPASPSYPRVTSPTLERSSSSYSSYRPSYPSSYYSRLADRREEQEEDEEDKRRREEERRRDGQSTGSRSTGQVVLNPGTIVIKRQGEVVNTSDEEESEEEPEPEPEPTPEPERDPLEVLLLVPAPATAPDVPTPAPGGGRRAAREVTDRWLHALYARGGADQEEAA